MVSNKLLTNAELQALRPQERAKYVHEVILNALDLKKEMTLSDIVEKTSLGRPTVTKHLSLLSALQQVKKEEKTLGRNKIAFYKKIGNILTNNESIFEADDNINYSFFALEDDEGKAICIQQKEEDEYHSSSVKGTIVIRYDSFEQFIKALHGYAAKVVQK